MEHRNYFVKLKTQVTSSGCLSELKLLKYSMKWEKKKILSLQSELEDFFFSSISLWSVSIPFPSTFLHEFQTFSR